MKKVSIYTFLVAMLLISLQANENNSTISKIDKDSNSTQKTSIIKSEVQKQMEREKKYAKEKMFYQGSDYNLSSVEVNKESLKHIKAIEPDYDFDMDDVYSDIQ